MGRKSLYGIYDAFVEIEYCYQSRPVREDFQLHEVSDSYANAVPIANEYQALSIRPTCYSFALAEHIA
jgi:hypothetical protein